MSRNLLSLRPLIGVSAVGLAAAAAFIGLKYLRSTRRMPSTFGQNLRGKIAVITGDSSDLGTEVAFQLAKRQMEIVLACRDPVKAQEAVEFIEKRLTSERSVGNENQFGTLHVMDLDLADLNSIDSFARAFGDRFENLHLLVNNAELTSCPYSTSRGGLIELQFATNHLGHFRLTNLLLPILKRSKPSRILIVTSGYYRKLEQSMATVTDFEEPALLNRVINVAPTEYDPLKAYAFSKLANCLHAVELSKRLKEEGEDQVDVFVIRPGFVRGIEQGRHFNRILTTLATPLIWMFSQTVEQAGETYLHCALAERSELKSGALYYNSSEQPYLTILVNEENASIVWRMSERLMKMEERAIQPQEGKQDEIEKALKLLMDNKLSTQKAASLLSKLRIGLEVQTGPVRSQLQQMRSRGEGDPYKVKRLLDMMDKIEECVRFAKDESLRTLNSSLAAGLFVKAGTRGLQQIRGFLDTFRSITPETISDELMRLDEELRDIVANVKGAK